MTGATGPKISSLQQPRVVGHVGEHGRLVEVAAPSRSLPPTSTVAPLPTASVDELGDLVALRRRRSAGRPRRRPRCRGRPSSRRSARASFSANSSATDSATWKRLAPCRPRRCCASWRASRPRPPRRGRRRRRRGTARCRRAPSRSCSSLLGAACSIELAADLGRAGEGELAQPRVLDQRLGDRSRTSSR